MTTVAQVIARSMRICGALSSGETPSTQEYSDGLEALNGMIKALSTTRQSIYAPNLVNASLSSSTTTFTIGSSKDVDTTRPKSILSAYLRDSNNNDWPLSVREISEYSEVPVKSQSGRPDFLYVRKGAVYWDCYFDSATDSAYTIYLELYQPLTTYTSTATEISLPGEYEDMYIYGLAVRIAPEFGRVAPQDVKELAISNLMNVKRQNSHPVKNIRSNPFGGNDHTNIYSG